VSDPSTPRSLHPNLAVLAADYDAIYDQWRLGQLDSREAKQRLARLVARDDEGVLWRLSPEDGRWLRQTRDLTWVPGEPPTAGVPSLTGWDVSGRSHVGDPRHRIFHADANDDRPDGPGATRVAARRRAEAATHRRLVVAVAVLVAVLALAAVATGRVPL
jgi:hypothetical protein